MRKTEHETAEVFQTEVWETAESPKNGRAGEAGPADGDEATAGAGEAYGQRGHVLAVERAVERLRSLGVRMTPQRYAILNYLYTHHEHPTAEEIYQALASEYPSMSVATVYNNLKVFKEAEIIQELTFGDQASRYDANPEDHYHVVCVDCGKVEDLPYTPYVEVEDEAARRLGYRVLDHKLVIYGICPECQRKGVVPLRRKRGEEEL